VAIVPAQAAALVEALLARQQAKEDAAIGIGGSSGSAGGSSVRASSRRDNKSKISLDNNSNKASSTDSGIMLDTVRACPNCEAALHWSTARYCYSCGDAL
jgi:hypothetical protein